MKNNKKSSKRKIHIVRYSVLMLALIVVFTGAFFILKNKVSLGADNFKAHSNYVDMDTVLPITNDEIYVTPKTSYKNVLNTGAYPSIPETNGVRTSLGTEDNPFVVLEIVPEMGQSTYNYLVSTPEEGLPYDPLEVGITFTNNKLKNYLDSNNAVYDPTYAGQNPGTNSEGKTVVGPRQFNGHAASMVTHGSANVPVYVDNKTEYMEVPQDGGIKGDYVTNVLQSGLKGWFENRINFMIYDPEGTISGTKTDPANENDRVEISNYGRIDKIYKVTLTDDDISIQDYASKSIATLKEEKGLFDVDNKGQVIRDDAIENEINWARNIEIDEEESRQFYLSSDSDEIPVEDVQTLSMSQLGEKYPELFVHDDNDNLIREKDLRRHDSWTKNIREESKSVVKVNDVECQSIQLRTDIPSYKYGPYLNTNEFRGYYLKMGTDVFEYSGPYTNGYIVNVGLGNGEFYCANETPWGINLTKATTPAEKAKACYVYLTESEFEKANQTITKSYYTFEYNYSSCKYTYTYYNLKAQDLLKRMLFTRKTDQEYEDIKIKVITITPSQLNEIDSMDTIDSLSYIERADMIYFSTSAAYGTTLTNWENYVEFYYTWVLKDKDSFDKNNLKSYKDDDLEWTDCMKIIKRLSTELNVPLVFTKQVGELMNVGVEGDGSTQSHIKLTSDIYAKTEISSLNNICKLYLIASQFDLSALKSDTDRQYVKTFMEDIFGNIKKIKLSNSVSTGSNTAQYTGYYERPLICDCGTCQGTYDTNCYYLWNRYTFIDPDSGFDNNNYNPSVLLNYGYLDRYLENNYLQGGNVTMSNQVSGVQKDDDLENNPQNVTITHNPSGPVNANQNAYSENVMSNMGVIIYKIMNAGTPINPTMKFTVADSKDGSYTKIDNESILIDYSPIGKYKNKEMIVKCSLRNLTGDGDSAVENKESGIVRKVQLLNPDTGDSINLIAKGYVKNGFTPSEPFELKNVAFSEDVSNFGSEFKPIYGIEVAPAATLDMYISFDLRDWQDGYNVIRVDWTARTSKGTAGGYKPYQNSSNQFAEVTISERGLFDLE